MAVLTSRNHKPLSDFLRGYVKADDRRMLTADRLLTPQAIVQSIRMLLAERVFTSPQDMRREAIETHGVIIPWEFFEEAKSNG